MNENEIQKPPIWFWLLSGVALLWNLLGLMAFLLQVTMSDDVLSELPEAEKALYESMPSWVIIAFAIGVFGGVAGSICLLIRKKWAVPVFAVSLVGILAQMTYTIFLSESLNVYGASGMIGPGFIIVIAIGLVVFSYAAGKKRWIT